MQRARLPHHLVLAPMEMKGSPPWRMLDPEYWPELHNYKRPQAKPRGGGDSGFRIPWPLPAPLTRNKVGLWEGRREGCEGSFQNGGFSGCTWGPEPPLDSSVTVRAARFGTVPGPNLFFSFKEGGAGVFAFPDLSWH